MSTYQEFQARFDELQKDIRAIDSKDTYQPIFLLQEASNLIRELLKESSSHLLTSDREGIQDWDGGEERYRAYQKEFWIDEIVEEEEEVTDDDENCWVEYPQE